MPYFRTTFSTTHLEFVEISTILTKIVEISTDPNDILDLLLRNRQ